MSRELIKELAKQGLKSSESEVYLHCYKNSNGLFVSDLAKISGIKRTTLDLIVKRLVERGYLRRVTSGKRDRYLAEPPENIAQRQEEMAASFKSLLPMLKQIVQPSEFSDVRFFEGVTGIRHIYDDMFATLRHAKDKNIASVSSAAHVTRLMKDYDKVVVQKRIRMELPIRILAPTASSKIPGWQSDEFTDREIRYFDESKFPFTICLYIYADKVALYATTAPVDGAIIRNKRIAESLLSFFNLVWISAAVR